ncbi:MAG: TCR/Tet family MFS transporter [Alphaproteobacteria bacterium]|nr:TCR/Tet family MFS transporter [Alphaproteobacteria bacterium]
MAFVFVTVMLDMLALGIVIPVLPKLIESFLGGDTARAAEVSGLFGTAWSAMQFLFSPTLGALSDRFGRRPVILLSNLGLGLDYVLMALAPSLWWLFVGRLVSGLTAASISTAFAYVADVTPAEKRAGAFGVMGAAFGVGFTLGPAIGGLLGGMDPRLPFWVAAGFSLANAAYGLLVLPESLPAERRAGLRLARANPIGALGLLRSHRGLLGLAGVHFLYNLAHHSLPAVFVLYAGYRYGWDEAMVGLTLAGVGVCAMLVQGLLVRPVVARIGERRTLLVGLLCGTLGFAIYGLAPTGQIFWIGLPIMALWGLAGPAAQGLMSARVAPDEQGRLQGALTSAASVTGLIGPGLFSFVFAFAIAGGAHLGMPGAPYLLAAASLALAAAIGWRAAAPVRP